MFVIEQEMAKDILSDMDDLVLQDDDFEDNVLDILEGDNSEDDFFYESVTDTNKIDEQYRRLKNYKSVTLSQSIISKYSSQYKNLRHVRIDDNTKGLVYFDEGNLVAIINTEKKEDNKIWIQGLEIFGDYKGTKLSYGLTWAAVKDLRAKYLSVRKTNKAAIHVYEKCGFKTYESDDYMHYMKI